MNLQPSSFQFSPSGYFVDSNSTVTRFHSTLITISAFLIFNMLLSTQMSCLDPHQPLPFFSNTLSYVPLLFFQVKLTLCCFLQPFPARCQYLISKSQISMNHLYYLFTEYCPLKFYIYSHQQLYLQAPASIILSLLVITIT